MRDDAGDAVWTVLLVLAAKSSTDNSSSLKHERLFLALQGLSPELTPTDANAASGGLGSLAPNSGKPGAAMAEAAGTSEIQSAAAAVQPPAARPEAAKASAAKPPAAKASAQEGKVKSKSCFCF